MWIFEMLSHPFMQRAAIVGLLVSLCAAVLGVSLVIRRYAMIGDGLSHVGFGALAIASALHFAPLAVALPVVVLAAFLLLRISQRSSIRGDSAIAIASTASLAIGVLVVSLTAGAAADVNSYLFGSILTTTPDDATLSTIVCAAVLVLFTLFYNRIFAITFDEEFARATGMRAQVYNMLVALLTAVTIVLGMRMMGALLISGLIIFPALSAMRVCARFLSATILAAVVSAACFFAGFSFSYYFSTPSGASVVLAHVVALSLFTLVSKLRHVRK